MPASSLDSWLKVIHVAAVISWMVGLLYLPRLFVYHLEVAPQGESWHLFVKMERRLLRIIMHPALLLSWAAGLALAVRLEVHREPWFMLKFSCVCALTILHMLFSRWQKGFALGSPPRGARFFRLINEVPAVLMVIILALVFVRPFQR